MVVVMDPTVVGDGLKRAAELQVDVKRNKLLVKSDQSAGGDETGLGMEKCWEGLQCRTDFLQQQCVGADGECGVNE